MATAPERQRGYLARKAYRFLAALVFRDFRFLALASLSSGSGAWALIVARGAWVFSIPALQETWGLWVGLITFAAMSPRFFATPFIGYLADRVTRKTLLQWVYALQLAQASVMAVLVMIGIDNPWYVVALAVINGTLRATQQTAAQSVTPNLVDRERLPNAVALNEAMQQGSRAVGPAILLAVSIFVGGGAIFQAGGASFSIQNLVLPSVHRPWFSGRAQCSTWWPCLQRSTSERFRAALSTVTGASGPTPRRGSCIPTQRP